MDHPGCNDTLNLLCRPVLAWLSSGDDRHILYWCNRSKCHCEQILARPGWPNYWMRFVGTGSGLPNATTGFKPFRVFIIGCIHRKKDVHNSPCYVADAYILLSQMDHSDALSFSPVSELFTLYVWYNPFPWDGTCSINLRKKPFSRATNITHKQPVRTGNAFRQTFLTQVFHSFTRFLLSSEYALTQRYLHWDSILSAFSSRSCNNKRCCPAVKHCQ